MKWAGETLFANVGIGASLLLFESPDAEGSRAEVTVVATGGTARIMLGPLPNRTMAEATIVRAAPSAATTELADGSKWSMTLHQPEEAPSGVAWPGGPGQDKNGLFARKPEI